MAISADDSKMLAKMTLAEGFASLFDNEQFSDFIVRCGDRSWKLHKAIICRQSEYFMKACDGDFKESKAGYIELQDDDPAAVDAMLRFFYTFDYDDSAELEGGSAPTVFNVLVFAVAEKYRVEHLQALAVAKFTDAASERWDKVECAEAVSEAYTSASDSTGTLRNAIADIVLAHHDELLNKDNPEHEKFRDMARYTAEFATEMAMLMAKQLKGENDYTLFACPKQDCKYVFKAKMREGRHAQFFCQGCGRWRTMACTHLAQSYGVAIEECDVV